MGHSGPLSAYLKHRLGFAIWIAEFTFLFIIFLENGLIREIPMGFSLFFWAWSALLLPIPLSTASPWKDSLRFFAYFFPLSFLLGLIPLIVPIQLVFRFTSILAITWTIIWASLRKCKPEIFDFKVGIHPVMFLETIFIWGLSFLCSHITVFIFKLKLTSLSFSPFANYMSVMLIFYLVFSMATVVLRLYKHYY